MMTDPLPNGPTGSFPDSRRARAQTFGITLLKALAAFGVAGFLTLLLLPETLIKLTRPYYRATAPRLPAPLGAYPDFESLGRVARQQVAGVVPRSLDRAIRASRPGGTSPNPALLVWASESGTGSTGQWDSLLISSRGGYWTQSHTWTSTRGGGNPNPPHPVDPKALQALADRLGPSVSPPPLERALIVSFWRKGVWTTRLYDRAAPPAPLVEIERRTVPSSWGFWLTQPALTP